MGVMLLAELSPTSSSWFKEKLLLSFGGWRNFWSISSEMDVRLQELTLCMG